MKNRKNQNSKLGLFIMLFLFGSCEKSVFAPQTNINDSQASQGGLKMSITDAPIDSPDVKGAFITISEIKVDGKVFEGFKGPKTVNLLELQNGNTLQLGSDQVAAGSYSKIQLLINASSDDQGNSPGCYITKSNGSKETLELSGNGSTEIELRPKNFQVNENQELEIIMDFDLRKSIKSKNNDFAFVTKGELTAAVRAEIKNNTGSIKGKLENSAGNELVVYVYKKGSFNANTETKGQGSSNIMFAKAITSAKINADGSFTLSYLPEGEYEIYCEKKSNNISTGLDVLVNLESSVNLKSVPVKAGAQTSLNLSINLGELFNI